VEDAQALRAVYEEIDRLEKTSITTTEYTNYNELFPPVLYAALALLALEAALRMGPFRRPIG
jgi:Ca-activated chloride channel family protein